MQNIVSKISLRAIFFLNSSIDREKKKEVFKFMNAMKTKDAAMLRAKPLFSTWQIVAMMMLFALTMGAVLFGGELVPVLAGNELIDLDKGATEKVMKFFVDVVSKIAKYVGLALALWGIINAVLAYRREDSEGIISNVKLLIVGAVLITVGFGTDQIYSRLNTQ